jgi:hypothetical protein
MVCVSSRSASTSVTDSRQAMRGSIEKYSTTAGDRWRVRYELPPGPDGRRRQRTKRGFLRQRDADRALREAIGSVQDGTYVEPNQDTVAQWLEEWLERRRPIDASAARRHRGKLAPSTWAPYRTYIDSMIVPVIGGIRLRDLQPEDLERPYDTLERTGGRGQAGQDLRQPGDPPRASADRRAATSRFGRRSTTHVAGWLGRRQGHQRAPRSRQHRDHPGHLQPRPAGPRRRGGSNARHRHPR